MSIARDEQRGNATSLRRPREDTEIMQDPPPRRLLRGMRAPLPNFHFIVLVAIRRLGSRAYPAMIRDYITTEIGFMVDLAQVYVTLKRLQESKPPLVTVREAANPDDTGTTVRVYTVTEDGAQAVTEAAAFFRAVASLEGVTPSDGKKLEVPPQAPKDARRRKPRATA